MLRYVIIFLILPFFVDEAFCQTKSPLENEFRHGKQMYSEGRYDLAMEILKPLTLPSNKSVYSPYAAYYYSLAAYENNYSYLAEDMLKNSLEAFPDWEQIDLVKFWLVKINAQNEEYIQSIKHLTSISDDIIKEKASHLVQESLGRISDLEKLKEIYNTYPDFKPLGVVLADRIVQLPVMEQDRSLLKKIVQKFDLNKEKYSIFEDLDSEKKDEYNVAVLLPFMLKDIPPGKVRLNNQFILDLYSGIQLAMEDLRAEGITINLFPFDTERDSSVTMNLINSGELDGIDLIIGPLYPEPVKIISDFSLKNRINMFNPLSENSDLIEHNPFCFLMKPTTQRQALEAEKYVSSYCDNKFGLIFYENTTNDSVMAYSYKDAIEEKSFDIIMTRKILVDDEFSVYDYLTKKEKFMDMVDTEQDSIMFIEKYGLDTYYENIEKIRQSDSKKTKSPEVFIIAPDSIGHIFVASDKELIGANVISGVSTRGDSILIIGEERWLEFRSLSLEQWELLDILLIAPTYISNHNDYLNMINEKILNVSRRPPSKYHYVGYELMNFIGRMLNRYGVYFQVGMRKMGTYPGLLYQGFDYTEGNDNAVVPLIKFENSEFIIVNKY